MTIFTTKTKSLRQKGFTLIEMAVTMAIAAILISAITPLAVKSAKIKAAEKTALEMSIIQEAARLFYINSNDWPVLLDDLQSSGYLNGGWDFINPFNYSYDISNNGSAFTVNTTVDSNVADVLASSLPSTVIIVGDPETLSDVASTIPPPGASAAGVPPGTIVMWSGPIVDIPVGYVLCDGTNGTPDLRDRFIVGARQDSGGVAATNVTGAFTQSGGTAFHTHGAGSYATPPHNHGGWTGGVNFGGGGSVTAWWLDMTHQHPIPSQGAMNISGTSDSSEHLPPYYALAYIMKF